MAKSTFQTWVEEQSGIFRGVSSCVSRALSSLPKSLDEFSSDLTRQGLGAGRGISIKESPCSPLQIHSGAHGHRAIYNKCELCF